MAQIQEYLPQDEAQGAVGGVTPNLEAVSLFGHGVEHVGASLDQAADVVQQRTAQQEISQTYGQIAQARASWNIELKKRLNDGTLDPDKFDNDYANFVNNLPQPTTAQGKDFFNRQVNRLGGTLMHNAMVGKAQLAGEQEYQSIMQGVNAHVSDLMSNPSEQNARDAMDATQEMIDTKTTITPIQKAKLKDQLLSQLASATVKGMANEDPGQDENGVDHPNAAKQFLDGGGFSEYLNEQQRSGLYSYAKEADWHRSIEQNRQDEQAEKAVELGGKQWMDQNFNRVIEQKMSTKEVENMPGTAQQKAYMIGEIERMNNMESTTDKPTFGRIYNDMLHGNINNFQDLVSARDQAEAQGKPIAPHDMPFLINQLNNTPDGVVVKGIQKRFYDQIDKSFNIKGVAGLPVPAAQAAGADLRNEIMRAEQAYTQSGQGNLRQFWTNTNMKDPNSPWAIAASHQIGLPQMIQMQTQQAQSAVLGTPSPTVNRYSNSPTKELPTPPPTPAPSGTPASDMRQPGETMDQYDKRMANGQAAAPAPAPMPSASAPSGSIPYSHEQMTKVPYAERLKMEDANQRFVDGQAAAQEALRQSQITEKNKSSPFNRAMRSVNSNE